MAILIDDIQMEELAQKIAKSEGLSVNEVVRESLLSLAHIHGLTINRPSLRKRLINLAQEVDKLPRKNLIDHRSDNEILGYNEHGIW